MWDELPDGQIHDTPEDDRQTRDSQTQRSTGAAAKADAHAGFGDRGVAAASSARILPLSRCSRQLCAVADISQRSAEKLAQGATASKPSTTYELGTFQRQPRTPDSTSSGPAPLPRCALHRQILTSKVGTVCASCASTGLCGGRRATVVPTATAYSQAVGREDFFDRRRTA